ncbi:MAG: phosphoribosyltransferase family protein [Halioglobus sp.]
MTPKHFITPQELLDVSYRLGLAIYESGYRPNYIVGVWRGGAPVGIAVQELLDFTGVVTDHIAIRTSSYTGIETRNRHVRVHGLNYIVKHVNAEDSLLLVDDVFDTGLSIRQVIIDLKEECRRNMPEVKVATPYFKPGNNKTDFEPDFFIHETASWLVFPHELHGLSAEEISEHRPELAELHAELLRRDA